MKNPVGVFFVLCMALAPLASWSQSREAPDEGAEPSGEERRVLAIAEVPVNIMAVARRAAPDVFFNGAESYWQKDFRVYQLSGRLFREVWNVYVREDGKLLRTESDNQDS